MSLRQLDESTFKPFIGSDDVCVVDFWAEWCGPCKMMEPILETAEKELQGSVSFAAVNVDNNEELAQSMSIMSIPTMIIFVDGVEADRIIGALNRQALVAKISEHTK